jgi:hypothetical protein
MKIYIRGEIARVVLAVDQMASVYFFADEDEKDRNTAPMIYPIITGHSKLTLPDEAYPQNGQVIEPGPWLDNVVRALGYEARRRRPRRRSDD